VAVGVAFLHGGGYQRAAAVDAPKVTSVTPSFGPISGGNAVVIHGENFVNPGMQVFFGGAFAFNTVVFSATEIQTIAPAGTGVVDIIVVTPLGGASLNTLNDDYTYGATSSAGVFEFSASTYSVSEAAGIFYVTVVRSGASSGFAQVNFATANGTAVAGADYVATSGTLNFGNGQTQTSFAITIINDTFVEPNETIILALSNPTGGTSLGAANSATLTIIDDESNATAGGTLAFSAETFTAAEGSAATIIVTRTGSILGAVSVLYFTSNGTAGGADYGPAGGTLSWAAGDSSPKSFSVSTMQDTAIEGTETVLLFLSNPGGGGVLGAQKTATLLITDDDIPADGIFEFVSTEFTASEGAAVATITVRRIAGSNSNANAASVQYATANGTAIAGSDYVAAMGTLSFLPGELIKTFSIPLIDDAAIEVNETIALSLAVPQGGPVLASQSNAILTITDNDSGLPLVTSVNPMAGLLVGGNTVLINGLNLSAATLVSFGGVSANIVSNTSTQLAVIAPARATAGPVTVQVTNAFGTSPVSAASTYTYAGSLPTVTSVTPASGPSTGGTTVVLFGNTFTGLLAVTFGGVIAPSAVANEPGKITVVSPPNVTGTVDVLVTTSLGTSTASVNTKFTYTASTSQGYTLSFRWNLITWAGLDNMSVFNALEGRETPDNPATTSITARVSAVFWWDISVTNWRAYFPSGAGIPGANDLTVMRRGNAYWVAIKGSGTVSWNIVSP